MDKFISAFGRSQHKKDDEGRSHQFAKRLAASTINDQAPGPTLSPSELSPLETTVYKTWWDELDPFGLGSVLDETLHPFLYECGLDQEILQQIIGFYTNETRYVEEQFYGILRLIAHGQSGRKINRDLVALGAPLAHFNSNAIDYRLRQDNDSNSKPGAAGLSDAKVFSRNTWWGQPLTSKKGDFGTSATLVSTSDYQQQQQQHQQQQQSQTLAFPTTNSHRHSYAGSTLSTPAFVSLTQPPPPLPTANVSETHRQVASWNTMSLGNNMALRSPSTPLIPLNPNLNQPNAFGWAEQALSSSSVTATTATHPQQQQIHPFAPSTTVTASTPTGNKSAFGHSRSRSVPYASQDISSSTEFTFDTVTATQAKQNHSRPMLASSRSSMDTTTFHRLLDQGQSLLLTQKFVPPASTTKSTNPFEDDDDDHNLGSSDGEDIHHSNSDTADHLNDQSKRSSILKSPFNDDEADDRLATTKPPSPAPTNCNSIPTGSLKKKPALSASSPSPPITTATKVTPTLTDLGNFTISTLSGVNQRSNKRNIPAPHLPPQSTKPAFLRYGKRQQSLKRSQSQHSGHLGHHHQRTYMSQGAFLLATSSASSSVQFPTVQPPGPQPPADDTTRLFRHRSTTSFPRK